MQSIFNKGVKGVVRQGCASVADSELVEGLDCKYRGKNGTRCALGWSITNPEYKELEEVLAKKLKKSPFALGPHNPEDIPSEDLPMYFKAFELDDRNMAVGDEEDFAVFLGEFQGCHDNSSVTPGRKQRKPSAFIRTFLRESRRLARRYNLKMPEVA